VRRAEREIKDSKTIEEIVGNATVCRLGLCDGDRPYVVPLSFGYEDNRLYFHSAPEGRKIEIIKANPKVCFEVDLDEEYVGAEVPCDWTVKYRSVIGFGTAHLLEDLEEKKGAVDVILSHYSGRESEYPPGALDKLAVVRVDVESMTGKQAGYQR
jgi:nitroimidazol reductase NimA-like FMN-containing flavoprotein (pyridoxamine 5'-phosphate oxidase superfamily)